MEKHISHQIHAVHEYVVLLHQDAKPSPVYEHENHIAY